MNKRDKVARQLNDQFRDVLAASMREKFSVAVQTECDFLSGSITTNREDGEPFTVEQMSHMVSFEQGYISAQKIALKALRAGGQS